MNLRPSRTQLACLAAGGRSQSSLVPVAVNAVGSSALFDALPGSSSSSSSTSSNVRPNGFACSLLAIERRQLTCQKLEGFFGDQASCIAFSVLSNDVLYTSPLLTKVAISRGNWSENAIMVIVQCTRYCEQKVGPRRDGRELWSREERTVKDGGG
ncbi:hypothetical protein CPC08DRAFT_717552 [Agrocybe pediades]|nr:hypothetical protein CPC08DRAFT_717552 [Agrocybe pediades]